MEELKIENPFKVVGYHQPWEVVKKNVINVVNHFPKENRIISDEPEKILLLKVPVLPTNNSNDQLLYISLVNGSNKECEVRYEMTNQKNKIESYNEQQVLINCIENFKKLVAMSFANTLDGAIKKSVQATQKKADPLQAILQFIIAIVAIILIINGVRGCNQ